MDGNPDLVCGPGGVRRRKGNLPPQSVRTGANVQGASPRGQHIAAPVDPHKKKKIKITGYDYGVRARGGARGVASHEDWDERA